MGDLTPAQAYRDGEPGFYVVERQRDRAVGGPFAHELSARNVRLALDAGLAGGLYDVVRLAGASGPLDAGRRRPPTGAGDAPRSSPGSSHVGPAAGERGAYTGSRSTT